MSGNLEFVKKYGPYWGVLALLFRMGSFAAKAKLLYGVSTSFVLRHFLNDMVYQKPKVISAGAAGAKK